MTPKTPAPALHPFWRRVRTLHAPATGWVRGRRLVTMAACALGCAASQRATDGAVAFDVPTAGDLGGPDVATFDAGFVDLQALSDLGVDSGSTMDLPVAADGSMDVVALPEGGAIDVPSVDDAPPDVGADDVPPVVLPPRLLAPLSGGRVSNRRPMLRWVPPPAATQFRVQLCADRACATVLQTVTTTATQAQPTTTLPAGVVFWQVTGLDATGASVWTSATWEFVAPRRDAPVDTAWGVLKDFNGDRYADVAAGDSMNGDGVAYAFTGSLGHLGPLQWTEPAPGAVGDAFGQSLSAAGDVNGDGFGDLIVGAPAYPLVGQGYLFLGSAAFLPTTPTVIAAPVDAPMFAQFAISAGSAGDLNGDGFGDVVFGELTQDRIVLELGNADGTVTSVPIEGPAFSTSSDRQGFGQAVAGAGDLDGDGYGDLVVGAPMGDVTYIYFGGPDGVAPVADLVLSAPPFSRVSAWRCRGLGISTAIT